jgi:hypothetical protein
VSPDALAFVQPCSWWGYEAFIVPLPVWLAANPDNSTWQTCLDAVRPGLYDSFDGPVHCYGCYWPPTATESNATHVYIKVTHVP